MCQTISVGAAALTGILVIVRNKSQIKCADLRKRKENNPKFALASVATTGLVRTGQTLISIEATNPVSNFVGRRLEPRWGSIGRAINQLLRKFTGKRPDSAQRIVAKYEEVLVTRRPTAIINTQVPTIRD